MGVTGGQYYSESTPLWAAIRSFANPAIVEVVRALVEAGAKASATGYFFKGKSRGGKVREAKGRLPRLVGTLYRPQRSAKVGDSLTG